MRREQGKMISVFSDENVALVRNTAYLIWRQYTYLDIEDLFQSGYVGLLKASRRYDRKLGASFATYAGQRILGEIIDEVRRGRPGVRRLAKIQRAVRVATQCIEDREQRPATNKDLAAEIQDYYAISQELAGLYPTELTESIVDSNDTETEAHGAREAGKIEKRLKLLTPREAEAARLYYLEGKYLHEIGRRLGGVTESRASQILKGAMKKLRNGDSGCVNSE